MTVSSAKANNLIMNETAHSVLHWGKVINIKLPESNRITLESASTSLDYESNQTLCSYQIKHHQPSTKFFRLTASDTTSHSETTCIIKNKLNPAIMSYWDNQKSLLHFLPMPPSGRRLPECIFPMSSQPVSHWGGNHKVETCTYTRVLVQPRESPKPDVIAYNQIETQLGEGCFSHWSFHRFGWQGVSVQKVSESVEKYHSRQVDHTMENGVRGTEQGVVVTYIQLHTVMCHSQSGIHFSFSFPGFAHGHNFTLHPIFLQRY